MKDLLTRALDAHGGLSRWREIEAFQLKVCLGGGLWRLKGLPDGLRDVTLRVQAHRPIVTITPFGRRAPGCPYENLIRPLITCTYSFWSIGGLMVPGAG